MRQELRDTYITHPCSSGKETEVAEMRIHTQVPQSCQGQTQAPLVSTEWGKPLLLPESLFTSLPHWRQQLLRSPASSGTADQCPVASQHDSSPTSWHEFPLTLLENTLKCLLQKAKVCCCIRCKETSHSEAFGREARKCAFIWAR